ncbi:MAG: NAD(P)-binding domain-containing protein [Acidimicrobiales bacterium]
MTTYGYVGLGMMGSAMVEQLVSTGADVSVFDVDEAAVGAAVNRGARGATSATEVGEQSDIVSICVPAAAHIESVLSGQAGLGDCVNGPRTILIHSTVAPATVTAAAQTAQGWGAKVFDACVAGGADNARIGELAIFAGGVDDMAQEVRDLLDIFGSKVIAAGPVGSGAALKIAVNVMTYAQFAAAAHSYDLITEAGADPNALYEAWRHIGQLGKLTESFIGLLGIPQAHIVGDFRSTLETQVGIAEKDLDLALELGSSRATASAVVAEIRAAMPTIYQVDQPDTGVPES